MSAISPIQASEETAQQSSGGFTLPLDPLLTLAAIGLGICSVLTIGPATRHNETGSPTYYVEHQAIYLVLGLVVMAALSRLDYGWLRQFKVWIYGALIVIMLAVFAIGTHVGESVRSISLPLFSFQSSELGKTLLIVFLAAFMVDRSRKLRDRETTALVVALAIVPTMLVVLEPDIGDSLVYIAITAAVLFVAGVPWRQLAALALLGVVGVTLVIVVAPALGVHVLKKEQMERLTSFLHPTHNVESSAFQQVQSEIAIGSGRQSGLPHPGSAVYGFVPENESDFIFTSLGVEHGFVGAALVLSLYALMIWRGLRILTMAKDLFGSLIAAGVVGMLMCQVFVNVGVATGITPDTGITLPLMSYGGSSVITTMIAIGLLQSIYVRARSSEALKGRVLRW